MFGSERPGEGWCGVGGELEIFISEGNTIGCVSKQVYKKAYLINDLFYHITYQKDGPLRSSEYFFAKCMF